MAGGAHSLPVMTELSVRQVEVRFVGVPPAQRIRSAAGVSDVDVDGSTLRCSVRGSFQPFLEALRGYEVTELSSAVITSKRGAIQT